MFMTTDDGFAPAGSSSNPRASRALVNLTDKVPPLNLDPPVNLVTAAGR